MTRKIDFSIIGEEFGELTVLRLSEHRSTKDTYWDCLCSRCGKVKALPKSNLVSGNTTSCGCRFGLAKKVASLAKTSSASVSLVMNGKWRGILHEEHAERILKVAKELNYQPYYRKG